MTIQDEVEKEEIVEGKEEESLKRNKSIHLHPPPPIWAVTPRAPWA